MCKISLMSGFLPFLLEFLLVAICAYRLSLYCFPFFVFYLSKRKSKLAYNEVRHHNLPTADTTDMLMPNPDFLVSSCFFNLEKSNLRINIKIPQNTYWLISLHANNMVHIYDKNNSGFPAERFSLILKNKHYPLHSRHDDLQVIKCSKKGTLLVRILVEDRSAENIRLCRTFQHSLEINAC